MIYSDGFMLVLTAFMVVSTFIHIQTVIFREDMPQAMSLPDVRENM